jgi:ABC-type phosphate/phosphonate transport system permease subunit
MRYCDVVLCPETAAAHDSAPAGRVIADVSAHVARAGRLFHRAFAKSANLAGDHCPAQGAVPSRPAVVCPIFFWFKNVLQRRLRLLDGLQNPATSLIWQRLWNTFLLSFFALIIAWGIAIPLGIWAAVKKIRGWTTAAR